MQAETSKNDHLELEETKHPKDSDEDSDQADGANAEWDSALLRVPTGRRLISGLVGINVVLLGSALVAGDAFRPLHHHEPALFLLLLMVLSVLWMLWYLLWARKQPGAPPHTDQHAGGVTVTVVLMLFAGFSLLLCVFRMVYNLLMKACRPLANVVLPFIQTPFVLLQTYLLWAHSKDCIHKHKVLTRSGLMLTLCTDILLWLSAVTEDTIHMEIELERQFKEPIIITETEEQSDNVTRCHCSGQPTCLVLRKGYEVMYPFNMEFSLMAGCMLYIMWKNVGRQVVGSRSGHAQKITLRIVWSGGVLIGPVLGTLVLISGAVMFVLYQVWVGHEFGRLDAFLMFYGFHVCVMPGMAVCSLAGTLVYRHRENKSRGQHEEGQNANSKESRAKNPTRSLDVLLLLGAGIGQLSLSYFSLVAAINLGAEGILGGLDLSYSLLSLLELVLQNIFIIQGLHLHTHSHTRNRAGPENTMMDVSFQAQNFVFLKQKGRRGEDEEGGQTFLQKKNEAQSWSKKLIQEICSFLILSNIMLWIIPAFGAHPQFEIGVGKRFFGFSVWFVLVNLGQPLIVFYRMHSVGALMELLISA